MESLVSIIVPVYNSEKTINRCIDSILVQTYPNLEIILIDDGSTDNTFNILKNYENYNTRIRVYSQDNQGPGVARNNGIKQATGEYIIFVDSDDYIENNYVETFLTAIVSSGDDFVVGGGYQFVNDKDKIISKFVLKNNIWTYLRFASVLGRIINRSFIIANNIKFPATDIGEDLYFGVMSYYNSDKHSIIPYIGYYVYKNITSVTHINNTLAAAQKYDFLINIIYNDVPKKNIYDYELFEFLLLRLTIFFILNNGKKSNYNKLCSEYKKRFAWLEDKFPEYKKNKYIRINKPEGETFIVSLYIVVFMMLHRLRLLKYFFWIYSKC